VGTGTAGAIGDNTQGSKRGTVTADSKRRTVGTGTAGRNRGIVKQFSNRGTVTADRNRGAVGTGTSGSNRGTVTHRVAKEGQ
jgi:hypothetical protein